MSRFGPPNIDKLKKKGDIDGLIKALTFSDSKNPRQSFVVHGDAAAALGDFGDDRAVEPISRARSEILDLVKMFRPGSALQGVGLPEEDQRAFSHAVAEMDEALRKLRAQTATSRDKPADHRGSASQGTPEDVTRLIGDLLSEDPRVALLASDRIEKMGTAAVRPLIVALQDTNPDMRSWAASLLQRIPDDRAVGPLIAALNDDDERVRFNAMRALGAVHDPRAIDVLLPLLMSASPSIRLEAISALSSFDTAGVLQALLSALSDEDPSVRCEAAQSLAKLNEQRATAPITRLLEEETDPLRRRYLSEALVMLSESTAAGDVESHQGSTKSDWYPDPAGRHQYRYWTGSVWTADVADSGRVSVDPLDVAAASAQEAATSEERAVRQPKPLSINLGDVDKPTLDSIVGSGQPLEIAQETESGNAKSALVTPDLARQALQAKQHEQRADSFAKGGKFRQAAEEYKRAIRTAPYEDEILYMSLGGVLSEIREYTDALQYLEIAAAINPQNEDVARNLAIASMNARTR